jgi:predicted nucleic acid-binding protein
MEASVLGSSLRRKGISIPATDLIIASSARNTECTFCHIDFHFDTIATHVSLEATNFKKFID